MSRVFMAGKMTLGRRVVVKVLPDAVFGAANMDRFRREVQLATQRQHPQVVALLTAGETDTREAGDTPLYCTMPLVEGETPDAQACECAEAAAARGRRGRFLPSVAHPSTTCRQHG